MLHEEPYLYEFYGLFPLTNLYTLLSPFTSTALLPGPELCLFLGPSIPTPTWDEDSGECRVLWRWNEADTQDTWLTTFKMSKWEGKKALKVYDTTPRHPIILEEDYGYGWVHKQYSTRDMTKVMDIPRAHE